MATPIMSGNPAAQAYLQQQYSRMQQYRTFWNWQPMTKKEAHAAAFQRLLAAKRQAEAIQRQQQQRL